MCSTLAKEIEGSELDTGFLDLARSAWTTYPCVGLELEFTPGSLSGTAVKIDFITWVLSFPRSHHVSVVYIPLTKENVRRADIFTNRSTTSSTRAAPANLLLIYFPGRPFSHARSHRPRRGAFNEFVETVHVKGQCLNRLSARPHGLSIVSVPTTHVAVQNLACRT